ncbi:DUF7549 family protein [Halohasta litorea]|uniref:TIGR04206 family protein n=1 Tax=Halohasta litorea TaxID=869891 RepID=A0ABD6D5D1_9EURY|nr:hypothetical protein [Halohasta litorea]
MVWIQREHAAGLAVLSAWLGALLPWNVTYSTNGGPWVVFVRFPLFEFQYTSGFGPGVDGGALRTVLGAIALQSGQGLETATVVWGGGGAVMLAALGLSVVYYADRSLLEAASVHPVRLMGGLLGVAALLFAVATVFVWTGGFGGTPIPIGVLLLGLLAWVLLRVELTDRPNDTTASEKDAVDQS